MQPNRKSPVILMALTGLLSVMAIAAIISMYDMYARVQTDNAIAYYGAQKYMEGFHSYHKPAAIAAPVVKLVAASCPVANVVSKAKVEKGDPADLAELLALSAE